MKYIIIILFSLNLIAQVNDETVYGKLVTIKNAQGDVIISDYIDSARIETRLPITVIDNLNQVPVNDVPPLPEFGEECIKDKLYAYDGQVIICLQTHNRTIFPPEATPNLFNFYREGTELEWMVNELVSAGDIRIYQGIKYECIMGHITLLTWTPNVTPTLWKLYVEPGDCPEWVQPTGAHDAYNIGDCITFNGLCYESLINANVWSPTVYPAGWQQVECP